MGNAQSESQAYGDMKSSMKMRLPLPEKEELEARFNKVLVSPYVIYSHRPICMPNRPCTCTCV